MGSGWGRDEDAKGGWVANRDFNFRNLTCAKGDKLPSAWVIVQNRKYLQERYCVCGHDRDDKDRPFHAGEKKACKAAGCGCKSFNGQDCIVFKSKQGASPRVRPAKAGRTAARAA